MESTEARYQAGRATPGTPGTLGTPETFGKVATDGEQGESRDREDSGTSPASWESRPLILLVAHILQTYHEPLRRELPELRRMAEQVEGEHAASEACPRGLARHLASVHESVLSHLEKEEQILFPLIIAGRGAMAHGPIQVMEMEHGDHLDNLLITRRLAGDFEAPAGAGAVWRQLYDRLQQLETDLAEHIRLENEVLFPRALCE
jgi:regulator of cell morphogenesis and NO signaling